MNTTLNVLLTHREAFLLMLCTVTYVALFVVAVQNSRRKIGELEDRLGKIRHLQEAQKATGQQRIEDNRRKIEELEALLQKLDDENSMLRLELEERHAELDYNNKVATIEQEKRRQAKAALFGSPEYRRLQETLQRGQALEAKDWTALARLVDTIYTDFTDRLYSLYKLTAQEYHVCLLTKVHMSPKDIGTLTAHSKESISSTRSRLYQKVFGRKGSPREWDEFVMSL